MDGCMDTVTSKRISKDIQKTRKQSQKHSNTLKYMKKEVYVRTLYISLSI